MPKHKKNLPEYFLLEDICPHCSETVSIIITREDLHFLNKGFNTELGKAQHLSDIYFLKRLQDKVKKEGWNKHESKPESKYVA